MSDQTHTRTRTELDHILHEDTGSANLPGRTTNTKRDPQADRSADADVDGECASAPSVGDRNAKQPSDTVRARLQRTWQLIRAQPAATLALLASAALWAAATGLIANCVVAVYAGAGGLWVVLLEAGDEKSAAESEGQVLERLALRAIAWATSLAAALFAGICWYNSTTSIPDLVRLWTAFTVGLLAWAAVGGLLWPRFARPKSVEYERWLLWSTVLGVVAGTLRAAIETFIPAAARAATAANPTADVFTRATDTVSRATFGMAMFGGVLFLALWLGSSVGKAIKITGEAVISFCRRVAT